MIAAIWAVAVAATDAPHWGPFANEHFLEALLTIAAWSIYVAGARILLEWREDWRQAVGHAMTAVFVATTAGMLTWRQFGETNSEAWLGLAGFVAWFGIDAIPLLNRLVARIFLG